MKKILLTAFLFLSLFSLGIAQVPSYSLSVVKTNDANGAADSLGVKCMLHGTIVGIDLLAGTGYVFTMLDSVTGIVVLGTSNLIPGYIVADGDSVHLRGTIDQNAGLTFLNIDSISLVAQGRQYRDPRIRIDIGESEEGDLVRLNNLQLVSPLGWPQLQGQFGRVKAYNATDTIEIIIDPETDIEGSSPPFGFFDVIGTGSQKDLSAPYHSDYTLYPQFRSHIIRKGFYPGVPTYTVSLLNKETSQGIADSVGTYCQFVAKLQSIDFESGPGYNFMVDERGDFINVRSTVDFLAGQKLKRGNLINFRGEIKQLNGMTYLEADSMVLLNLGTLFRDPFKVSRLQEDFESRNLVLEKVRLVDTLNWPTAGNSASLSLTDQRGNIFELSIDPVSSFHRTALPYGYFDIGGIEFQDDSSIPYTEGYSLRPERSDDLNKLTTTIAMLRGQEKLVEANYNLEVKMLIEYSRHTDHEIKLLVSQGASVDSFDYTTTPKAINDTLTIAVPALSDTVSFIIHVKDDTSSELTENLRIKLLSINTNEAQIGARDEFTLGIQDNDSRNIAFRNDMTSYHEGIGQVDVNLFSYERAPGKDTLKILVKDGPGITSGDYNTIPLAIQDTILIYMNAGDSLTKFQVNILDDAIAEKTEQIEFEIIELSGGLVIGNNNIHALSIRDNEPRELGFTKALQILPEDSGKVMVHLNFSSPSFTSGQVKIKTLRGLGVNSLDFNTNPRVVLDTLALSIKAGDTSLVFEFEVLDDLLPEGTEEIRFSIVGFSQQGFLISADSVLFIKIVDNDLSVLPTYNISTVKVTDSNGLADSIGVPCRLQGIVLGIDFLGTASPSNAFTIVDNSGGIGVVSSTGFTPPYPVKEGDEVLVSGRITQIDGLTFMLADSLALLTTNNPIQVPLISLKLTESTESRLIQLTKISLLNPGVWPSSGRDGIMLSEVGTEHYVLYIDKDTDIDGTQVPRGLFTVTGIGSQQDQSLPFDSNYLIIPRYKSDIVGADHRLLAPANASTIKLNGLGTQMLNFTSSLPSATAGGSISYEFLLDSLNGDFSNPLIRISTNNLGQDTVFSTSYSSLDAALLAIGIPVRGSLQAKWTIRASNSMFDGQAQEFGILLTRDGVGIEKMKAGFSFSVFPNPSRGEFLVESNESSKFGLLKVYDLKGRLCQSRNISSRATLDMTKHSNGIYFLELSYPNTSPQRQKIVIND